MSKLIYTTITSFDGFSEDDHGLFDWAVPDAEVHTFLNDLEAEIGTHLYGRRMYQTMAVGDRTEVPAAEASYAEVWRATDKVVYSRTRRVDGDVTAVPRRDQDLPRLRRVARHAGWSNRRHRLDVGVEGGGLRVQRPGLRALLTSAPLSPR